MEHLPRQTQWHAVRAALGQPALLGPLTGAALLLSFPPLGWWPLAWVAGVPLLAALGRGAPGTWLGAGWGLGLVYFGGQYAWLAYALVGLGGVSVARFCVFWLALVGCLALLPALALAACAALRQRWGFSPLASVPVAFCALDALLCVAPWGGVPWGSLAGPQAHTLAAGLLAPWVGGSGLVLALWAVNAGWTMALHPGAPGAAAWRPTGAPRSGAVPMGLSAAPASAPLDRAGLRRPLALAGMAALTLALAWPAPLTLFPSADAGTLPALLVPGNLTMAQMQAPGGSAAALRAYLGRTLAALADAPPAQAPAPAPLALAPDAARPQPGAAPGLPPGPAASGGPDVPTLVVWPESAVPESIVQGNGLVELSEFGTLQNLDFALGSETPELGRLYNSIYLVRGGRFDFARYDKRRLVPFGEYVPAGFGWAFGRKVTAGSQDYAAGREPPVLPWRGHRLGLAICFESVVPAHLSHAVQGGAEALLAMANDAWLTPGAQRQHLELSALRGREVGRDVLFVSNGGLTALLREGRAVRLARAGGTPLWVTARLAQGQTPWVRWGWPLLGGLVLLWLLLAGHLARRAR